MPDQEKNARAPSDLSEEAKRHIFEQLARNEEVICPLEGCAQQLIYGKVQYGNLTLMAGVCPLHGNITGGRAS